MSSESLFNQYFKMQYKPLVAFAFKYVKSLEDSEEIVQTFFTDLIDKQKDIREIKNFKAYSFQSIYHRCLNHIKASKVTTEFIDSEIQDVSYNMEESIEATEFEYQIYELINALPKTCQEVFKCSRFESMTNEEIAVLKNISKRTVETHISNALKALRKKIYELESSDGDKMKLFSILF